MNEGKRESVMAESNNLNGSLRRRSARVLSSPPPTTDNKMAPPPLAVKRSITVRKIAPRKTVAPSEHDKENTPRRSERRSASEGVQQQQKKKQNVSTPGSTPGQGGSSSAKKAVMPSPILPSTPPPASHPPAADPEDLVWSQKVRRSYSRLSDKSLTSSPDSRETLFGFEKLQTPEVFRKVAPLSKTAPEVSASLSGVNSFTSLLEAEDCGAAFPEPDLNIPGVAVVKEKRRRKKVQNIDPSELDAMAARMNAEFEEAEDFELFVE